MDFQWMDKKDERISKYINLHSKDVNNERINERKNNEKFFLKMRCNGGCTLLWTCSSKTRTLLYISGKERATQTQRIIQM